MKSRALESRRGRNGTSRPHHTETGTAGISLLGLPSFLMELLFPTLPNKLPALELSCPGSFGHSAFLELQSSPASTSSAQIPDVQPGSSQLGPGCSSPASLPKTRDGFQPRLESELRVPKAAPEGETGAGWDNWECSGSRQGKGFVREANKKGKSFFPQISVKFVAAFPGEPTKQGSPFFLVFCEIRGRFWGWVGTGGFSSDSFLLLLLSAALQPSGFPIPLSPFFLPFFFLQEDPKKPWSTSTLQEVMLSPTSPLGSPLSMSHLPWLLPEHPRS